MADTTETTPDPDTPNGEPGEPGKEDQLAAETEPKPDTEPSPKPEDEPLGEGGKKALHAERSARSKAEKELKAAQKELEQLREAQMSEQEKAIAEARREGKAEATTETQRKLFTAEAKVAASTKLADPSLLADPDVAKKLLGFDEVPVTDAGDIDSKAISESIDKLLADRPYLAQQQGKKPADPDFGAKPPATVTPGNTDAQVDSLIRRAAGRTA